MNQVIRTIGVMSAIVDIMKGYRNDNKLMQATAVCLLTLTPCFATLPSINTQYEDTYFAEDGSPFRAEIKYNELAVEKAGMVAEETAVFYPETFDQNDFFFPALVSPPAITRDLHKTWSLTPTFMTGEGKHRVVIQTDAPVSFYGTGEVKGPLERTNTSIDLWTLGNTFFKDPRRNYQAHPFVMGVRKDGTAFGIIACSTYWMRIDIHEGKVVFSADGPAFPVLIFECPSPQAVVKRLGQLTGTMELPPKWALGFHQCKFSYYPDTNVIALAEEFRKRQIPCDTIWLDIHYMKNYQNFSFDPKRFPDPKGMNDKLREMGFKTVWIIDPYLPADTSNPITKEGLEKDVFVKAVDGTPIENKMYKGTRLWPDYTSPEVREWWIELHQDFLKIGLDGIWNDKNEPNAKGVNSMLTFPLDAVHRGGGGAPKGTHLRYRNLYGFYNSMATKEALKRVYPDRRPFVLTRSSFLGGQRYAAAWSGDNPSSIEAMKVSIPMAINHGLSGQPFNGPDIPGIFFEHKDKEFGRKLHMQWYAVGAFYPFMRSHAISNNNGHEPWAQGEEAEKNARVAIERRYRLLPYVYTLFQQSAQTGSSIMNPVFFADPQDLALRKEEEAFLLGQDLLIIPKWAEKPALPKGIWETIYLISEDSEKDTYQADLKVRGGAIIPLGKVIQNTTEKSLDPLTLLVCLDENGKATGQLYEDAGNGYGYKSGEYLLTTYQAEIKDDVVVVRIKSAEGNLPRPERSVQVKVAGRGDVKVAFQGN